MSGRCDGQKCGVLHTDVLHSVAKVDIGVGRDGFPSRSIIIRLHTILLSIRISIIDVFKII